MYEKEFEASRAVINECIDKMDAEILRLRKLIPEATMNIRIDDDRDMGNPEIRKEFNYELDLKSLSDQIESIRNFASLSFDISTRMTFDKWHSRYDKHIQEIHNAITTAGYSNPVLNNYVYLDKNIAIILDLDEVVEYDRLLVRCVKINNQVVSESWEDDYYRSYIYLKEDYNERIKYILRYVERYKGEM